MKLNLGIPDEFIDLMGNENVKFKLYHFRRGEDGTIDYSKTEEIECVFTPYGIIAEVQSFSPYVLVAVLLNLSMLSPARLSSSRRLPARVVTSKSKKTGNMQKHCAYYVPGFKRVDKQRFFCINRRKYAVSTRTIW